MSSARAHVRAVRDAAELARAAADEIQVHARAALDARGAFHVALSGGSTPRAAYAELARRARTAETALALAGWHFWFGDERCVPPDHPDSNFRMARETLFGPAHVPAEQAHRLQGELEPARAAALYEQELACALGSPPRLDLVLLGLGADGHTASLFPGSPALLERERSVVAVSPSGGPPRVTLTFPVLDAARAVLFLVAGPEKAEVLRRILAGEEEGEPFPAARVRPRAGSLAWIADRAALGERLET